MAKEFKSSPYCLQIGVIPTEPPGILF